MHAAITGRPATPFGRPFLFERPAGGPGFSAPRAPQDAYRGVPVGLATMHGKQRAIAKPFARVLSAPIVAPAGIDTDAFGTFTGEIERPGTMLDAARAKAHLAADATGLPCGLGSEGSFGPHPLFAFTPAGRELLVFVDRHRRIEVREHLLTPQTNFNSLVCRPADDVGRFLESIGFPAHAATVVPHEPLGRKFSFRGIFCAHALRAAMTEAARASADGRVRLGSDMRAHVNPTRMASLRVVAYRLARRLATPCPRCRGPGFGFAQSVPGLPCEGCSRPTSLPLAELHRCPSCGREDRRPVRGVPATTAQPMH